MFTEYGLFTKPTKHFYRKTISNKVAGDSRLRPGALGAGWCHHLANSTKHNVILTFGVGNEG